MIKTLINHIPSTLIHVCTAIVLMHLLFNNRSIRYKDHLMTIALGVTFVLVMDVPKLSGIIVTHSVFLLPWLGLLFAGVSGKFLPFSLWERWWRIVTLLLVAALSVDVFGNGAHLLYPLNNYNYAYSIINKDSWLILTLLLLSGVVLFKPSHRNSIYTGLLILILLLGGKTYTKITLEHTLKQNDNHQRSVIHVRTEPIAWNGYSWRFTVYQEGNVVYGEAIGFKVTRLTQ